MKFKRKKERKPKNIPYKPIILIFLITFLIRIIFVLSMKQNAYSIITRYTIDSIYYHEWALQIAQGNWIGTEVFFLGPFYAYFLAIIYALGGSLFTVQIIQSILTSLGCVFLYLITRQISSHRNAVIACIIYALTGILVFYAGALLYVEVNIFFSLWLAYLLLKLAGKFSTKLIILAGIVFGMLIMIRPEFILLLIILIPFFIIKVKVKPILQYLLFTIFALITISIIPIRNYLVGKDFVPFTAHSGVNFYYGNNPQADGTWRPVYPLQQTPDITIPQLQYSSQRISGKLVKPSEASNYWLKQGLNFIKENPIRYVKLLSRKFLLFINGYEIPNNYYYYQTKDDSIVLKICFISFGIIFPFAVMGIILSFRRWKEYYLLYCFIFIYFLSALAFYVLSRLRAPVIPFLIIFAVIFIFDYIKMLKAKKNTTLIILSICVTTLIFISNTMVINKKEFNTQGYIQKGNIYQSVRKLPLAVASYQKARVIDPENVITRYSLLQTYISMNHPAQAAVELHAITNLALANPKYQVYAHLSQARYSIAVRNFTQAAAEFEKAVLLNPYDAETHYLLGAVYITLNRYNQALIEIKKTLELDPNHQEAKAALSLIQNYIK